MTRKKKIVFAIAIASPLLIVALWMSIGSAVCQSETLQTISDLNSINVETIYTNCDTLAKTEQVDVYLSDANTSFWTGHWRKHREVVFSYDPWSYDSPGPVIEVVGRRRLRISIPRVSSISKKNVAWRDISIDYKIGQVQYR